MIRAVRRPILIVALLALTQGAGAHDLSRSESTIAIAGPDAHVRLSLNLLALSGVDANSDTRVSYEEMDKAIERVFALIKTHYNLRAPEPPTAIVAERYDVTDDHVLQISIKYTFDRSIRRLDLTSTLDAIAGADHQHAASATIDGAVQRSLLDGSQRTASFYVNGISIGRVAAAAGAGLVLLALALRRLKRRRLP